MSGDEELWRPGAHSPWLFDLPPTPVPGDGTRFFTGPCVLYCRGAFAEVFYAGTIHVPGVQVDGQICAWCARDLQQVALIVKLWQDGGRGTWSPPGPRF